MRLSLLALCFLSACATTDDCSMSAFEVGQRDGVLAADQSGRLAARCGSSFDTVRYAAGFSDGLSRRGRVFAM